MAPAAVGIVGYGLAGRVFHAPLVAASPWLRVSAIVTADPARAEQAATDYPGAVVVPDVAALLAQGVDMVVVAAPTSAHVPIARACIEAGVRAVVVDKPLAASAAEARGLIQQAVAAGTLLTVYQNRRWDGDFLTLRHLLAEDRLGPVHRFESRYERWRPQVRSGAWREDPAAAGGLLYDLGSHLVDQALVAFGPVREVYAELASRRADSAVDDDDFVALHHANGVTSHLWMSAVAPLAGPRFRVLGGRAAFVKEGMDPQEEQLAAGLRPGDPGWGAEPPHRYGRLGAGDDTSPVPTLPGSYQTFYAAMAAALLGDEPWPVDPWDAVAALEVIEAAQRSSAIGQVVRLG